MQSTGITEETATDKSDRTALWAAEQQLALGNTADCEPEGSTFNDSQQQQYDSQQQQYDSQQQQYDSQQQLYDSQQQLYDSQQQYDSQPQYDSQQLQYDSQQQQLYNSQQLPKLPVFASVDLEDNAEGDLLANDDPCMGSAVNFNNNNVKQEQPGMFNGRTCFWKMAM